MGAIDKMRHNQETVGYAYPERFEFRKGVTAYNDLAILS